MTDHDLMRLDQLRQCLVKISIQRPRDWCAENLYFDEPNNRGPFRLAGQEYIGDVLDDFANPLVADEVLVWGSQTKKTGTLMGGAAWAAVNDPCRFLWVMPSLTLAQSFSSNAIAADVQGFGIDSQDDPNQGGAARVQAAGDAAGAFDS